MDESSDKLESRITITGNYNVAADIKEITVSPEYGWARSAYDALVHFHILSPNIVLGDSIERIVIPKPKEGWPNYIAEAQETHRIIYSERCLRDAAEREKKELERLIPWWKKLFTKGDR